MTSTSGALTPRCSSVDVSISSRAAHVSRAVVAGPCCAFVTSGRMKVDCVCPRGDFEIRSGVWDEEAEEVQCGFCCHGLEYHGDFVKGNGEDGNLEATGTQPQHGNKEDGQWAYDASSTTGTHTPTTSTSSASTPVGTPASNYSMGSAVSRKVLAGRCSAFVASGRMKAPCVCRCGEFETRGGVCAGDELVCMYCCHELEDHADYSDPKNDDAQNALAAFFSALRKRPLPPRQNPRGQSATDAEKENETPPETVADESPVPLQIPEEVQPPDVVPGEIPRTETLRGLLSLVLEHKVVQAMGPNCCGKTILAKQLESFTKKNLPQIKVHRFSWPRYEYPGLSSRSPEDLLRWATGSEELWQSIKSGETVMIIIDDVQHSFYFNQLWNEVLDPVLEQDCEVSKPVPFLAVFGTYKPLARSAWDFGIGSDSVSLTFRTMGYQINLNSVESPTPSLYYSFREFSQATSALCSDISTHDGFDQWGTGFTPTDDLLGMIWHYGHGHPYVTRILVELIRAEAERICSNQESATEKPAPAPENKSVSLRDLPQLSEIFSHWGLFVPVLMHFWAPSAEIWKAEYCGKFESGTSIKRLVLNLITKAEGGRLEDPSTELLEKNGWVVAKVNPESVGPEDPEYIFATPFHRNYMEMLLWLFDYTGNVDKVPGFELIRNTPRVPTSATFTFYISAFLSSVLRGMRALDVSREYVQETDPKRRSYWRDLFYRAVHDRTGGFHLYKNEDVPAGTEVEEARPYFTFTSARCSFDFTCEEESLDYYASMLSNKQGGAMHKWATKKGHWWVVVLDIRSSIPTRVRSVETFPWLYHVIFIRSRILILNAELEDVTDRADWVHQRCLHGCSKES